MKWRTGESGNPLGRRPGERTKVWEIRSAILAACKRLGDEQTPKGGLKGFVKELVRDVREREPGVLLRTLTSLLPREILADVKMESAAEFAREIADQCREMDRVTMPFPPRMPDVPGGNGGNGGSASVEHYRKDGDISTDTVPGG